MIFVDDKRIDFTSFPDGTSSFRFEPKESSTANLVNQKAPVTVYVLRRYWDTPDNEGNDIMGVYYNFKDAQDDMHTDVRPIHEHYPEDFWSPDMTWAEDNEIHLGFDPMNGKPATVYCWEIVEMEVQ